MKYPIEQIMYGSFIKYERMAQLTQESFGKNPFCCNATNLHVYIDMNSLIKTLYMSNDLTIEDYTVITSSIINLCAHIREFYRRIGVKTKIIIIYSENTPLAARQFYTNYNQYNQNNYNMKFIHTVIEPNIELLNLLCKYLPDIHFIKDNTADTSTIIYRLISMNCNQAPSLIYSKDTMVFQIVTHFNNAIIFRPKKNSKDGDISFYADNNNAITAYKYATGRKIDSSPFSQSLLSLLMSISGVKSRSITTQRTITQAEKLIKDYINCNILIDGYNSFDTIAQFCQAINGYEFASIFRAIDVVFQNNLYLGIMDSDFDINLYDPEAVQQINNEYFRNYPLDLNRL